MRVCDVCKKGKWQGLKKDGKFVCIQCLAEKKAEAGKKEE